MNSAAEKETNHPICPVCQRPIHDFDKIQLHSIESLDASLHDRTFLHEAASRMYSVESTIWRILHDPDTSLSKGTLKALEFVIKEVEEGRREARSAFYSDVSFPIHFDDELPLTEAIIPKIHSSLDEFFRFHCELRVSGLQARPLDVKASTYRRFLRMLLQLSLFAVGRQPEPQVTIEYLGKDSFVSGEVRLRKGATLELDEMQLNLVSIKAHLIKIPFQSQIQGEDRLFRWRIPLHMSQPTST